MQELGITVTDLAPKIFPSAEDCEFASHFLENCEVPILAVHPGSGSEKKNWPIENWIELIEALVNRAATSGRRFGTVLIVSGEADENARQRLRTSFDNESRIHFVHQLPLPHLGALLAQSTFIGHDSGISHLAAAAGARSIVLFGPTEANVWAPRNKGVSVLIAPNEDLAQLAVATVLDAIMY